MGRREQYSAELREAPDRVEYLRAHSGLPGPRGNLELVQAAVDDGDEQAFREWIELGSGARPTDEFLAVCGIVGLGRLVAETVGTTDAAPSETRRAGLLEELRTHASDPRWRAREAVAMALQRVGDADTALLFRVANDWAKGRAYVQRAAIAAVAEPRLLKAEGAGRAAVDVVARVTENLVRMSIRRSDEFRTLRQALAYCWSVVVAGDPSYGWPVMERWIESSDPDIRWLMSQNLAKARLLRVDAARVQVLKERMHSPGAR
jgi:hypothetical protein